MLADPEAPRDLVVPTDLAAPTDLVGPTDLVDPHGRTVRDLRISITDRCNLRCQYCMPEEGMKWLPRSEMLSFEEILRVARVCVERFSFTGIRLTGGEPTVRSGLVDLVASLATLNIGGDPARPVGLAMTTNGVRMAALSKPLADAGLGRVNISCDSLRPERFAEITRRPQLSAVLEGISAAVAAGLHPVKVNCVLVRGVNDDEIIDFVEFGRSRRVEVRFIEWMPLDGGGSWGRDAVVPASEVLATINSAYPLEGLTAGRAATVQPAEDYSFVDGAGRVGVIASVTRPFCGTCDRVRITAEGQFRNCLFALAETDLRAILRSGGSDDHLAAAIVNDVGGKWAGHAIGQVHFVRPGRSMSQIGG